MIVYNTLDTASEQLATLRSSLDYSHDFGAWHVDLAESLLMSMFHAGQLRTMKAHYRNDAGDIRIIRPLVYCRETQTAAFARQAAAVWAFPLAGLAVASSDTLTLEATVDRTPDATGCIVVCHPHPEHGGTMRHPMLVAIVREANRRGLDRSSRRADTGRAPGS